MGNYISCTLAVPLMKNTRATRVIFPTGEVKQYKEQVINAAELMMECPTHFLTNSKSLHIGRRFSALGADEDLECANVYIFFPMRRLNSVVTPADVAVLFMVANATTKRVSNGHDLKSHDQLTRVGINDEAPRLSLEGVELGFGNRLSYCRSRKPLLETINEEPIWLR
ncbi:uncharacterized protein LOC109809432 [Cajanus cajan]|uniref:Uncharacterized protein n=1 Tax=Cajanus cajan TaxID=3821 RepID=A0A151SNR9_CAJCA|nr:uncharacterized protein LOC109809432 [Cajanus cajan]XP_020228334.1 uncharacterized protein LOC109809432 [Cajanus cajan]XP_020228335.1 uncharacterized protein LOC109809432 [Cajanus cajan]KYP56408.1 hypothetical protein KK1_002647 [Cajanus cajan]